MPRKFSETYKRKWLELSESGRTEKSIARDAKCDVRTVKRGIEEARRKQYARVAGVELVKEALRKHQDSLLEGLEGILSSLTIPQRGTAVLSWHQNRDYSIFSPPETTSETVDGDRSQYQGITLLQLLKEHLKNDRLWKALEQREKAYAAHRAARIALQLKTVSVLEQKTGYKLVDRQTTQPFLYSYTTGDMFFTEVLEDAFAVSKSTDLENDMIADTQSGWVVRHGSIMAEAPGNEEMTKHNLIDALRELKSSPEVTPVVDTYKTLEEITKRARQIIEQIKLLGLIPGQCQICRRLGI